MSTCSGSYVNDNCYQIICFMSWNHAVWNRGPRTSETPSSPTVVASARTTCTEMKISSFWRKFSSLAALKVVILITCVAASDGNSIQMITFPFQCGHDPSVKNGLAPAVWYHTLVTTASRFMATTIPHWGVDRLIK